MNCLRIEDYRLPDEKLLFLSDVYCSAWHACELGHVVQGVKLGVWGCGPIGLMVIQWAKYRGVREIIAVDNVPERLEIAKSFGCYIVDFSVIDPKKAIHEVFPRGVDVSFE